MSCGTFLLWLPPAVLSCSQDLLNFWDYLSIYGEHMPVDTGALRIADDSLVLLE